MREGKNYSTNKLKTMNKNKQVYYRKTHKKNK